MSDEERLARRTGIQADGDCIQPGWYACRMDSVVRSPRRPSTLTFVLRLEDREGQPLTSAMGVTAATSVGVTVRGWLDDGGWGIRDRCLEIAEAFGVMEQAIHAQALYMDDMVGRRAMVRPTLFVPSRSHGTEAMRYGADPYLILGRERGVLAPHPAGPDPAGSSTPVGVGATFALPSGRAVGSRPVGPRP